MNELYKMILKLRNILPNANKNGEIILNEKQIQMFEKTLQKHNHNYKNKKVIILKKRASGFMYKII